MDRDELKRIFESIDYDGDGEVTLDEYKRALDHQPNLFRWFEILNSNKSVYLDAE